MWVYRRDESLCKLLTANNVPSDLPTNESNCQIVVGCPWTMCLNECKSKYCPSKTGFIWKFCREWLLCTGMQAEATQQRKTTKGVCNIVFHFVSAQLSMQYRYVFPTKWQIIFLIPRLITKYFFRRLFLVNSQIAKCIHGTKLNALENSFGLFWDNLLFLWKSEDMFLREFKRIIHWKSGKIVEENMKALEKWKFQSFKNLKIERA